MSSYAMHDQSHFPSDLPLRPRGSFKDRNCTNTRRCFSFTFEAYSFRGVGGKQSVLWRRICNWLTMLARTALSILNAMFGGYGRGYDFNSWITSTIIGSILGLIGLISVAWCLATIDAAEGSRRFLGMRFDRKVFNIFVYVYAAVNIVFCIVWPFGVWGPNSSIVWSVLWLLIIPVSIAATRPGTVYPAGAGNV